MGLCPLLVNTSERAMRARSRETARYPADTGASETAIVSKIEKDRTASNDYQREEDGDTRVMLGKIERYPIVINTGETSIGARLRGVEQCRVITGASKVAKSVSFRRIGLYGVDARRDDASWTEGIVVGAKAARRNCVE
ncbi:hypothetical protein KM043_017149 [Ampulex compressa]|nr:hypothetical protein KM043_017149 [Ampulex compressa]